MPLTVPDQNIALQAQAPDGMKTIGSMLNMAQGSQQLQASQIANQSNQANLQERNNVRGLFQNPKDMMDEQGNIDFNKAAPAIMAAAPTQGGQIITSLIGAQNQSIQTKKEVNALSADQRAQVGQFAMSLGSDDPATGMAKFDAFIKANPGLSTMGAFAKTHMLEPSMGDPAAWQQATNKIGQSIMSPDSQRAAMTPSGPTVTNGIQNSVINTNPMAAGGVGQSIPGTTQTQFVPLGQQQSTLTDPQGNPYVQNKNASGVITGVSPMPGQAAPGTPGAYPHMSPGQPADIAAGQAEVQGVRTAGDQVGNQANINQQILKLSRDTTTGPASGAWQKVLGNIPGVGNSYQELGKYLEKNALSSMASMGGAPSDARLGAAMAANGSTSYNAGALQDVTKFNDAATTALGQYRTGVDKAVGLKNSDYTALPQFKAAWAKNLDPNVFRAENAIRDGDTMELQKLKTELGPKGMAALAQKRLNLTTLSQTGRLPQ